MCDYVKSSSELPEAAHNALVFACSQDLYVDLASAVVDPFNPRLVAMACTVTRTVARTWQCSRLPRALAHYAASFQLEDIDPEADDVKCKKRKVGGKKLVLTAVILLTARRRPAIPYPFDVD